VRRICIYAFCTHDASIRAISFTRTRAADDSSRPREPRLHRSGSPLSRIRVYTCKVNAYVFIRVTHVTVDDDSDTAHIICITTCWHMRILVYYIMYIRIYGAVVKLLLSRRTRIAVETSFGWLDKLRWATVWSSHGVGFWFFFNLCFSIKFHRCIIWL